MKKITLLIIAGMLASLSVFGVVVEEEFSASSNFYCYNNSNKWNQATIPIKSDPIQYGTAFFSVFDATTENPDSVALNFEYTAKDPGHTSVEIEICYETTLGSNNPIWNNIKTTDSWVTFGTMTLTDLGSYRFSSPAFTDYVTTQAGLGRKALPLFRVVTANASIVLNNGDTPSMTFYSNPASQFIAFDVIAGVPFSEATPITLIDTASSGLTVSYVSSDLSVATVVGNVVTPVGEGKATITASQAGDVTFDPAADVEQEIYYGPDAITYYVREGGDDDNNNGLSVGAPFATISKATATAVAGGSLSYTIDVDGTLQGGATAVFNTDYDITYAIVGASADASIIQLSDDATFESKLQIENSAIGRFLINPKNSGAGNLMIEMENLTMRNFGYTNTNGGGFFNMTAVDTVDIKIKKCNIMRGVARDGAFIQILGSNVTFTMEDCFVSELYTVNKSLFGSPFKFQSNNSIVVNNCVFSNMKKQAGMGTAYAKAFGSVFSFLPSDASASLSLVNNTFVGDSILETNMTLDQSAVYLNSSVAAVPLTIANNIFVGGYNASPTTFYDVHVDAASSALALTDCSNNVMTSQLGLDTLINTVDSTLIYISDDVNFTMDGNYPELFTTATGVSYVKANGDSIFEMGLASVATTDDIAGSMRNAATPCIGAFEATTGRTPTFIEESVEANVALYPNPATDLLYITGDVAKVELFNISGRMVQSSALVAGSINVSSLAKGVYFVKCQNEAGSVISTERILKK